MSKRRPIKRVRLDPPPELDPVNPYRRRIRDYSRVRDAAPAAPDDARIDGPASNMVPPSPNGGAILRVGTGRPAGATNLVPRSIKQAITEALQQHEDGAVGYLFRLSVTRPDLFTGLLRRLLPIQVRADLDPQGLASRMLQVINAQRSMQANGANRLVDVTPNRSPNADDNG